uniref:SAP domain-containing protein n=1 Tax=Parascaris univalens TaxID=6257 RepID=A0A914ZV91_PARUN
MSQFGAKNPAAWARPPGGQQLNAGIFQSPLIGGQAFGGVPQMGMPGMINAAAFSQQAAASIGMNLGMLQTPQQAIRMQTQQQQPQQKNRTFSGVVTKMHDSYGFVDDDVFFQVSVVRGALPRTGDRVMVEASYNPAMPFKWNAFRVQLIPTEKQGPPIGPPHGHPMHSAPDMRGRQPAPLPRGGPTMGQPWPDKGVSNAGPGPAARTNEIHARESRAMPRSRSPVPTMARRGRSPPPSVGNGGGRRVSPPPRRASPPRGVARRSPPKRSPARSDFSRSSTTRAASPKRISPPRKHETLKRERSPSGSVAPSLKRETTGRDSVSPPRRRARIIPRYHCYSPKTPISMVNAHSSQGIMHLRKRYASLYIPSDFIEAVIEWPATTPLDNPISISTAPTTFHVLHKDVDIPKSVGEGAMLSPSDADSRFSAKVILMCHGGLSAIQQKAYGLLADGSTDDNADPTPLSRCLSFLVGTRGKGELMALGGTWSRSLDGENPDRDPQVLVRTAIRTVRALTGVDLSKCARWYKMAQLRYYRAEKDRVDTTVLLLPETSALMPDEECYREQLAVLKNQLATKISAVEAMKVEQSVPAEVAGGESGQQSSSHHGTGEAAASEPTKEQVEEVQEDDDDEDDLTPTHWSKLDIKTMKVAELRQELMARDLETKGVKSVLCVRLQEALNQEKAKEEGTMEEKVESEKAAAAEQLKETKELTEEQKKALEKLEKEKKEKKASLERHYAMPKEVGVLVYPSRLAKGGKFDCKVVTLHNLLDYRIEDCKEHTFELALLAECVSEMLDRAHAFGVYKSMSCALDKEAEKKRRNDAKVLEVIGVEHAAKKGTTSDGADKIEKSEEERKKEEEKREEDRKKAIAEPRKAIVVDRSAFNAFSYFDQNLCGYVIRLIFPQHSFCYFRLLDLLFREA